MKKRRISLETKRSFTGLLFILPWLLGFIFFYVRSLFMTVQFSFSSLAVNEAGAGYNLTFVGWENFRYAFFEDPDFKQILTTSIFDMVIDVPLITFFSLFMALLLNRKFKGRTVVRAIFFLPVILNSDAIVSAIDAAAAMMADGINSTTSEMAGETAGMGMAYYMELFGNLMIPREVLSYIVGAVARITSIISASGVQIVIFIAALQSVPSSLYEVAKMEGATGYETFWKVTFPMVMPHIITNIVYTVVDSFTSSEVVNLAYSTAFSEFNYGLSSAFSLVSTIITCAILAIVVGLIQRRTFYYT